MSTHLNQKDRSVEARQQDLLTAGVADEVSLERGWSEDTRIAQVLSGPLESSLGHRLLDLYP